MLNLTFVIKCAKINSKEVVILEYIKIPGRDAKKVSWSYNPQGLTDDERWQDGDKVQCIVYPIPERDETVVLAKVEAGAFHGRTIAKSDYHYTVLLGQGEFFFYREEKLIGTVPVKKDDCIIIPEGVDYDYQAQSQNLEIHLLMNNLWNGD